MEFNLDGNFALKNVLNLHFQVKPHSVHNLCWRYLMNKEHLPLYKLSNSLQQHGLLFKQQSLLVNVPM